MFPYHRGCCDVGNEFKGASCQVKNVDFLIKCHDLSFPLCMGDYFISFLKTNFQYISERKRRNLKSVTCV